jgi:hypothetical protein
MTGRSALVPLAALLALAAVWYALSRGARPSPGGGAVNSSERPARGAELTPEQKALAAARKLEEALDAARPFSETQGRFAGARAELDAALRGVSAGGVAENLRRASAVFGDAFRVLGKREQQRARRQGAGGPPEFIALDEEDGDDVALAEMLTGKYGLRPAREPDIYTTFNAAEVVSALRQQGRDHVARAEAALR